MHNVLALADQAEAAARNYATFARHAEVQLVELPANVQFVADVRCGCRSEDCYFCGALDDAVYQAAWEAEEAEQAERYGSGWYVVWDD